MQKIRCLSSGFTLIEIMVVLVILGVLAALVAPKIMDRPDQARVLAAKQDIATISQALKLYKLDNHNYPTTQQGLAALVQRPTTQPIPPNWRPSGYLERLPSDPWGHPYMYAAPGLHGEIDVMSYGSDGQGTATMIGSWMQ
jgi:general secretion pathway protein G